MRYRNKETGAEIDVNSELGGAWVPVKEKKAKAEKPKEPEKAEE